MKSLLFSSIVFATSLFGNYDYSPENEAIPSFVVTGDGLPESKDNSKYEVDVTVFKNPFKVVQIRDRFYHYATKDEFNEIRKAWAKYRFDKNLHYIFDIYDCDNYANSFKAFVETYNLKYKKNIAIGKVVVQNVNDFAFIKGSINSYHMLNVIYVDGEPIMFEPQNDIFVKFNKYPNKKYILEIEF